MKNQLRHTHTHTFVLSLVYFPDRSEDLAARPALLSFSRLRLDDKALSGDLSNVLKNSSTSLLRRIQVFIRDAEDHRPVCVDRLFIFHCGVNKYVSEWDRSRFVVFNNFFVLFIRAGVFRIYNYNSDVCWKVPSRK